MTCEGICRHVVDIENIHFDKGLLQDTVDEVIAKHDSDEICHEDESDLLDDDDRHLIDMALQLSQQSEANTTAKS